MRKQGNFSISNIAKASGIPVPTLYCIERGMNCDLTTAFKVARFFGRPIEELWRIRKVRKNKKLKK
ncbi:MAG: helix-turn-helix transcriptional regulator [Patescibacteria group bacterium]|nr:helix-turn-helix transcriptional regulator [Patescibacteria group bacterium]MDE2439101.1 helix-turn-helix transcriptional regulator [Patescibacteria group bacterium]